MRAALTILFASVLAAGCASQPAQPVMSTQGSTVVQTARVISIRDVTVHGGQPSGVGAFAGALLGGVTGSKIGSGYGSAAASVGGALAGGMAGQRIEESGMSRSTTEVTVRFDSGETLTYHVEPGLDFRIGDTVTVTTSGGISRINH